MANTRILKAVMDLVFWQPKSQNEIFKINHQNDSWGEKTEYQKVDIVGPFLYQEVNEFFPEDVIQDLDEKITQVVQSLGYSHHGAKEMIFDEYSKRQRYVVTLASNIYDVASLDRLKSIIETDKRFSELKHFANLHNLRHITFGNYQIGITNKMKTELESLGKQLDCRVSSSLSWLVDSREIDCQVGKRVETTITTSNGKLSKELDGRNLLTLLNDDDLFCMVVEDDFKITLRHNLYPDMEERHNELRPMFKYIGACDVIAKAELDAGARPELVEIQAGFHPENTMIWLKTARPEVAQEIYQYEMSEKNTFKP